MTHAHYSVHGGFDRATRTSEIVLMKPFPSQTPSVFSLFTLPPIPRDDAKGEEFPIDGADNGAAKMQRPSCLFETIFRMREG